MSTRPKNAARPWYVFDRRRVTQSDETRSHRTRSSMTNLSRTSPIRPQLYTAHFTNISLKHLESLEQFFSYIFT